MSILDITKNEGAIINTVTDAVTPGDEEEDASEEVASEKETYVPKAVAPKVEPKPDPVYAEPGVVVVTYTDSGFLPPVVEVTAGDSVTFVNLSSKPMWVTSEDHPTAKAQIYRGFDQGKSVPTGETYIFDFTKVGVWGYKNLNLESHLGAISVVEQ